MIFGVEWYLILGYIAIGVANTFLLRSLFKNVKRDYRIISMINRSVGYMIVSWTPVVNFSAMIIMSVIWWVEASTDTKSQSWYNKRIVRTKE